MTKTNTTGQLNPLEDRMSQHQLAKRAAKIEARHTVAQQLSREHAITRGVAVGCLQVLQRGLWGRLKWLLRGK